MRELFKKIFEHIISREEETYQMDKRLGDCMEEYISRYQGRFSEKDMEALRDCVYYAILLTEEESFYLGMKYMAKMLLSLLEES